MATTDVSPSEMHRALAAFTQHMRVGFEMLADLRRNACASCGYSVASTEFQRLASALRAVLDEACPGGPEGALPILEDALMQAHAETDFVELELRAERT